MVPYEQIADEAWARLERAANERSDPHRLCAFASLGQTGDPDVRYLILRGAERGSARLWFHTDRRSAKAATLRSNPRVALVSYDANSEIQLRVKGSVRLHEDDGITRRHWEQLGVAVRLGYESPAPPGAPTPHADPRMDEIRENVAEGRNDEGLANLMVIVVDVESIDWLQLGEPAHRRAVMRVGEAWIAQPIQP
jgi:general stress protein 26